MKNPDQKLSDLWKRARTASSESISAQEPLTPGIATRTASRWAAQSPGASPLALFERITVCCLVPVAIALVTVVWLHPRPTDPDLMSALFSARIEIENDFPF